MLREDGDYYNYTDRVKGPKDFSVIFFTANLYCILTLNINLFCYQWSQLSDSPPRYGPTLHYQHVKQVPNPEF